MSGDGGTQIMRPDTSLGRVWAVGHEVWGGVLATGRRVGHDGEACGPWGVVCGPQLGERHAGCGERCGESTEGSVGCDPESDLGGS